MTPGKHQYDKLRRRLLGFRPNFIPIGAGVVCCTPETVNFTNHGLYGLYGSTSCCISQWPSQWERANFDPPQLQNHLTDFDENGILELPSEDHPPCKISFRSDDVGGLGEYPVCHCWVSFFVFFCLFVTRTGRTGGPILTIYT